MAVQYPDITPEMLAEFEDRTSGKLKRPADARIRSRNHKDPTNPDGPKLKLEHALWYEFVTIDEVAVVPGNVLNNGTKVDTYKVTMNVLEGPSTKNANRKLWLNLNLDMANPSSWMSMVALNMLTQLVRAVGVDTRGGIRSAQMAAYFPENSPSPLLGKKVKVEIDQWPDPRSITGWRDDVANIYPFTPAPADAEV